MLSLLLRPFQFLFYSRKNTEVTEKCNRDIEEIEKEYVIHPYLLDNLDTEHIHKFIENKKETEPVIAQSDEVDESVTTEIEQVEDTIPVVDSNLEIVSNENKQQTVEGLKHKGIITKKIKSGSITKKTKSENKRKQKKNKKINSRKNKKEQRRQKKLRKKQEILKKRQKKHKYNLRNRS